MLERHIGIVETIGAIEDDGQEALGAAQLTEELALRCAAETPIDIA
jgi:hypothetical protein